MEQLTEALKKQYKKELEYIPEKDFYSEFDRTAELQMKIIASHGFEGLQLVLKNERCINLGCFPADCPWYAINDLTIPEAVDALFSIDGKTIPAGFVDEIKERCLFICTEKTKDGWELSYVLSMKLYTNKTFYSVIKGGEPLSEKALHALFSKLQWEVPEALADLYRIHNGLFKEGTALIRRVEDLTDLKKIYPDLKKLTGIKPTDVLRIADNGGGNLIAYVRNHAYLEVVDIDHETLEATNLYGIVPYLDSSFENLDEIDADIDDLESDAEDDLEDDPEEEAYHGKPYTEIVFRKKYTITSTSDIPSETIDTYRKIVPAALIHLWETKGLPRLNNGLFSFINPDEYIGMLDLWLGKHKDNYVPFAIGAFGNLFYYRKLTKDTEDICVIDPHYGEIDTCEWSLRDFFEIYVYDEYPVEYVLREKQYKKALKKNGELTGSEMYMFTPALALGGEENGNSTEKGDIKVHLQFLFELTQSENSEDI